jgi:hypothetical protein
MPGLGHRGWLRLATETAWANGVANALGVQYLPFKTESLRNTPAYVFPPHIRAERNERRKVQTSVKAGGSLAWDVDVEDVIGILLKNILPTEDFTNLGSGNGGRHIFTPGDDTLPPGLVARINRDVTADANNIWEYVGGRVRKLDFSASEGGLLEATADLSFKSGAQGAGNATPSYTTQNPLVYHQGAITVAGQSVAVKSFKLSIDAGLLDGRGQLGSQFIQQQQPGMYKISGEIDTYFDSLDQVNQFLDAVDVDITLDFLGTALGTSTRQLKFQLPTVQFTGEAPTIANPQEIMLKLPFTAYRSGNGGLDEAIAVTLLNSVQQTY